MRLGGRFGSLEGVTNIWNFFQKILIIVMGYKLFPLYTGHQRENKILKETNLAEEPSRTSSRATSQFPGGSESQ